MLYDQFILQWNLIERNLIIYGNVDRVNKLIQYGLDNPLKFNIIERRLLEDVLSQHCVFDEERRIVKPYIRESYVFLRRNLGLQPELCSSCPTGIQCNGAIGQNNNLNFANSLLLILYQIKNNYVHLGKFEVNDRNNLLLQFAEEILRIANQVP